jgi:prepilin-type N-terminal cleavage/methylation domain-containing protein
MHSPVSPPQPGLARAAASGRRRGGARGFTLLELLVVIAVIGILASLLFPALAAARQAGRKVACLSNLRQIGLAIYTYADDSNGSIPYGPKAPPFTSPASFYPSTGAPTSLLSLQTGAPVGLGLLLREHLANQPRVLFCAASDQPVDAGAELAKVGQYQAQGSYYYRHGGNTQLFDGPANTNPPPRLRLDSLAIDTQFLAPPDLAAFNVRSRTHHRLKFADVLHADGSVLSRPNRDARFTMDFREYGDIREAFDRILRVLEEADAAP